MSVKGFVNNHLKFLRCRFSEFQTKQINLACAKVIFKMSSFSEEALEKKLADLNNSQQSIQQLSLWLIHHRKHYHKIVSVWYKELHKTASNRKLTFLYLANDVVQNSRKKAPEFSKEFGHVMKKVLAHLSAMKFDEKTIKSIGRLINIWKERNIFDAKVQTELGLIWEKAGAPKELDKEPGTPPLPKKPRKGRKI